MICRTSAEAFQAGLNALCAHDLDPVTCDGCRLTTAEIRDLVVIHRGYLNPTPTVSSTATHAA